MTNPNDAAFAEEYQTGFEYWPHYPLTKREYFAALAMQAMAIKAFSNPDECAEYAVKHADSLIKELNK